MPLNSSQKKELDKFKNKKILILGLKREGMSTFRLLRKYFPEKKITLADQSSWEQMSTNEQKILANDKNLELFLGESYLDYLRRYDIIFKTPGIPPTLPQIIAAKNSGVKIESQTRLFFKLCPAPIIGITGTKGKSTTTSLINHILSVNALPSRILGNIGLPALDQIEEIKKNEIIVMELSCHQLADLDQSPKYAVIQDITAEHLDYYPDIKTYCQSKEQITKFQTENDFVIYALELLKPRKMAEKSQAKKLPFCVKLSGEKAKYGDIPPVLTFSKDGLVANYMGDNQIELKKIPLKGKHNLYNIAPAIILGFKFGLSSEQIQRALESFTTLPHRLQYVTTKQGVEYYNDSMGTTPEASIAAIKSFKSKSIVLLAGGSEKNSNFEKLAKTILTNKVKEVLLFPPTGERIKKTILEMAKKMENQETNNFDLPKMKIVGSMNEAVKKASRIAKNGDVVLLSPACASFGLFKDYADRGNQFVKAVQNLI